MLSWHGSFICIPAPAARMSASACLAQQQVKSAVTFTALALISAAGSMRELLGFCIRRCHRDGLCHGFQKAKGSQRPGIPGLLPKQTVPWLWRCAAALCAVSGAFVMLQYTSHALHCQRLPRVHSIRIHKHVGCARACMPRFCSCVSPLSEIDMQGSCLTGAACNALACSVCLLASGGRQPVFSMQCATEKGVVPWDDYDYNPKPIGTPSACSRKLFTNNPHKASGVVTAVVPVDLSRPDPLYAVGSCKPKGRTSCIIFLRFPNSIDLQIRPLMLGCRRFNKHP